MYTRSLPLQFTLGLLAFPLLTNAQIYYTSSSVSPAPAPSIPVWDTRSYPMLIANGSNANLTIYNLANWLSSDVYVGVSSTNTGTIQMLGGTWTSEGTVALGTNSNTTGTVLLSGGTWNAEEGYSVGGAEDTVTQFSGTLVFGTHISPVDFDVEALNYSWISGDLEVYGALSNFEIPTTTPLLARTLTLSGSSSSWAPSETVSIDGSSARLTLSGGTLSTTDDVFIGNENTGQMILNSGTWEQGQLSDVIIGDDSGSDGHLSINGGTWNALDTITIGKSSGSEGSISMTDGAWNAEHGFSFGSGTHSVEQTGGALTWGTVNAPLDMNLTSLTADGYNWEGGDLIVTGTLTSTRHIIQPEQNSDEDISLTLKGNQARWTTDGLLYINSTPNGSGYNEASITIDGGQLNSTNLIELTGTGGKLFLDSGSLTMDELLIDPSVSGNSYISEFEITNGTATANNITLAGTGASNTHGYIDLRGGTLTTQSVHRTTDSNFTINVRGGKWISHSLTSADSVDLPDIYLSSSGIIESYHDLSYEDISLWDNGELIIHSELTEFTNNGIHAPRLSNATITLKGSNSRISQNHLNEGSNGYSYLGYGGTSTTTVNIDGGNYTSTFRTELGTFGTGIINLNSGMLFLQRVNSGHTGIININGGEFQTHDFDFTSNSQSVINLQGGHMKYGINGYSYNFDYTARAPSELNWTSGTLELTGTLSNFSPDINNPLDDKELALSGSVANWASTSQIFLGVNSGTEGKISLSDGARWTSTNLIAAGASGTARITLGHNTQWTHSGAEEDDYAILGYGNVGIVDQSGTNSLWDCHTAVGFGGFASGDGIVNLSAGIWHARKGYIIGDGSATINLSGTGHFIYSNPVDLDGYDASRPELNWTGGTLEAYGPTSNVPSLGSGMTLKGDLFTGSVINTAGTFAPGHSTALTTINGDYNSGVAATLEIEINGALQGSQYDALQITGIATLAGTLTIASDGAYAPHSGEQFQILTATGGITGTFSGLANGDLVTITNAGTAYYIQYDANSVSLIARPGFTYSQWLSNYQLENDTMSDFDGDGLSTLFEYVYGGDPEAAEAAMNPIQTVTESHFNYTYRLTRLAEIVNNQNISQRLYITTNLNGEEVEPEEDEEGEEEDLSTWQYIDDGHFGISITTTPNQFGIDHSGVPVDGVTVSIPRSLAPEGRLFIKMNYSQNEW